MVQSAELEPESSNTFTVQFHWSLWEPWRKAWAGSTLLALGRQREGPRRATEPQAGQRASARAYLCCETWRRGGRAQRGRGNRPLGCPGHGTPYPRKVWKGGGDCMTSVACMCQQCTQSTHYPCLLGWVGSESLGCPVQYHAPRTLKQRSIDPVFTRGNSRWDKSWSHSTTCLLASPTLGINDTNFQLLGTAMPVSSD